ncbi:MAG: methylmalonyl-CoA mutase family protein [Acidobacteriota bacterium]
MPESGLHHEQELRLLDDFPPVPAEEWEAAIRADLKGADYEKKLIWKTPEGIAVRPYYRREDLPQPRFRHCVAREWEIAEGPLPEGVVNGAAHHERGATAVQELGFTIAEASDRLAAGAAVAGLAFGIGSVYFMEIAKLRAARLLYARVAEAYGQSPGTRIHAVTALSNKSIYDPWTNLLRSTTEALAGVLGGADSLRVQAAGYPARLARNVQLILKEEAHLDKVADPAGGSWFIESLTASLAAEAWKLFQQVESMGGFAKARAFIDSSVAAAREAKEKEFASRRRVMVGVNNYPDLTERRLEQAGSLEGAGWRLARPVEKIRLRTERHARRTGKTPKVLLLKRGDLKMKMARAQFCLNFFGCGGFAIEELDMDGNTVPDGADLIVLCSSDREYLDFAREVCPRVSVPVIVAGNPKEQIEALREAGAAGFVHIFSNLVETLSEWQQKLGIDGKED